MGGYCGEYTASESKYATETELDSPSDGYQITVTVNLLQVINKWNNYMDQLLIWIIAMYSHSIIIVRVRYSNGCYENENMISSPMIYGLLMKN